MGSAAPLFCDGCGQLASPEHVARRLQRLEWSTRYRPIHVNTLFLGAIAPVHEADFLYSADPKPAGEAKVLLESVSLSLDSKAPEAILSEFQRAGFLLGYLLECPLENADGNPGTVAKLLEQRLPAGMARIRRSWKPKKLAPISRLLDPLIARFVPGDLGCTLLLDGGKAFALDEAEPSEAVARLQKALALAAAAR